jgi:hypothetical protein
MNLQRKTFDISTLKRVEEIYRKRLVEEPGDMVARLSLAWCLFMQALHQAGQESLLAALAEAGKGQEMPLDEQASPAPDHDSSELLTECLKQTITVMQLSPNPQDRTDVERIQALVRLSGEEEALSEAEEEAARILGEMSRAILRDTDVGRARSPRSRTRSRNP